MQIRNINADDATPAQGPYTQAVEVSGAGRMLFLSGQLGTELDGSAPPTMEEQARLAWRNLGAQLRAAGMSFDNLVKITMLIADVSEIAASRAARIEALGERRPASTVVVAALANPAWKIEIEAIACA